VDQTTRSAASAKAMFASYAQLAKALVSELSGMYLTDAELECLGHSGALQPAKTLDRLRQLDWLGRGRARRDPTLVKSSTAGGVVAFPVETSEGRLLGVLCLEVRTAKRASDAEFVRTLGTRVAPLLESLRREMSSRDPGRSRLQTLSERTTELEWLFKVTSDLRGMADTRGVLEAMLQAATERLGSVLGVLVSLDGRLYVEKVQEEGAAAALREQWTRMRQPLMHWAQRQRRPLVINASSETARKKPPCKLLAVPLTRKSGRVIGLLAFFNAPSARDYGNRYVFLARHLGRQVANVLDAQFDLLTGLYTRDGLEAAYRNLAPGAPNSERSVIYLDVDHLHVVNELHGFEIGNEVIARIADLLSAPNVPADALVGRLSGDRFAIVLPSSDIAAAKALAGRVQFEISRLAVGSATNPVEVSVSCGVAGVAAVPQGLERALSAAELACKVGKGRGLHRVEAYASEDDSMIRRHDDVLAVGRLREALKADRLVLYAQRIAPLQDPGLPGGYEILLRVRAEDGTVSSVGPLIGPAERYQLLPSIDRWVMRRAFEQLAAYRQMLQARSVTMSINLSGQSMGDETLIAELAQLLKSAGLPAGCLTLELTEQAAVKSLARANQVMNSLGPLGVRFALDDFGTGANSLTYLNGLQIRAVKIDGSFVRDVLSSPRSQATVRGIVELARGFSVLTVAEYVETEPVAEAVRALGVDYGQGYAFGMPEPLERVLEGLAHDESQRLHRLFLLG
jgi:diguanylate cyclase (GGDEF)-like protein